jgi:hypothetical protein
MDVVETNLYKGSIYMVFGYMDHDLTGLAERPGGKAHRMESPRMGTSSAFKPSLEMEQFLCERLLDVKQPIAFVTEELGYSLEHLVCFFSVSVFRFGVQGQA